MSQENWLDIVPEGIGLLLREFRGGTGVDSIITPRGDGSYLVRIDEPSFSHQLRVRNQHPTTLCWTVTIGGTVLPPRNRYRHPGDMPDTFQLRGRRNEATASLRLSDFPSKEIEAGMSWEIRLNFFRARAYQQFTRAQQATLEAVTSALKHTQGGEGVFLEAVEFSLHPQALEGQLGPMDVVRTVDLLIIYQNPTLLRLRG